MSILKLIVITILNHNHNVLVF